MINEVSSLQMKKTVIETELDLSSVGHLMVEVRNGLKDIRMLLDCLVGRQENRVANRSAWHVVCIIDAVA